MMNDSPSWIRANTPDPEPTTRITVKEYERLKRRDDTLARLEAAGVDNWDGYHLAFEDDDEEEDWDDE